MLKVEDGINDEACELVNGVELSIGEGADSINAYLFKAVKNNNGAGILLLSDVFGFEDSSTREFAYRVACNGYKYVCLTLNFQDLHEIFLSLCHADMGYCSLERLFDRL